MQLMDSRYAVVGLKSNHDESSAPLLNRIYVIGPPNECLLSLKSGII